MIPEHLKHYNVLLRIVGIHLADPNMIEILYDCTEMFMSKGGLLDISDISRIMEEVKARNKQIAEGKIRTNTKKLTQHLAG